MNIRVARKEVVVVIKRHRTTHMGVWEGIRRKSHGGMGGNPVSESRKTTTIEQLHVKSNSNRANARHLLITQKPWELWVKNRRNGGKHLATNSAWRPDIASCRQPSEVHPCRGVCCDHNRRIEPRDPSNNWHRRTPVVASVPLRDEDHIARSLCARSSADAINRIVVAGTRGRAVQLGSRH
jgi:hypothetical protein